MVGPAPSVARVRVAVRDLLQERMSSGSLQAGGLLLVACSGGADSLALASQTAFLAPRSGLRAGAVVVDHGLPADSAVQARRAAQVCAAMGLDPVVVVEVDALPSPGPETSARSARYRALSRVRDEQRASGVLLGHTLDDQAETVLLALAHGSGTLAMAGMATIRGRWWRPLLGVRRSDTAATCAELGLDPYHDPTNAAAGPWRRADGGPLPRAAVRDRVLPALADALGVDPAPALARTARLARADAALLGDLANEAYERCVVEEIDDVSVALDIDALGAEPEALRMRTLQTAVMAVAADVAARDIAEVHLRALDALVIDWHGQGPVSLPGGVLARRDCGRLVLAGPS